MDISFTVTGREHDGLTINIDKQELLEGKYDVLSYAKDKLITMVCHHKAIFEWMLNNHPLGPAPEEVALNNYLFDLSVNDPNKLNEWFLRNVRVIDYAGGESYWRSIEDILGG